MSSTRNKQIIAPIAIDVGAAHTGVFRAKYEQGTAVDRIDERHGEVLTLDNRNYTLMMRDRTAKRHMRRGFDRRKLAKRLLALVLQHFFEFPAHEHRQALGFLMNRRGFTFLQESFDAQTLGAFPKSAWDELPSEARKILKSRHEVLSRLEQLIENDAEVIEPESVEVHLKNLVFAIHQVYQELASGSRHRRKYFEEIKDDIKNAGTHPHRYMQNFARAIADSPKLDGNKLYHVIAHISNLELKPLRAYFNDKAHRAGDQWQPEKLAEIVSRWFRKQWRVDAEKNGEKKVAQYRKLKKSWAAHRHKDNVVAFWLATDPEWTIPPYQSQTNRRPPACQSLILNPVYMERDYKNWKHWMDQLDTSQAPDLTGVTRRKSGEALANENQRKLRQLQFLLDRAQQADPYRLNLIWSQYHRRQKYAPETKEYSEADEALKGHIRESTLRPDLKGDLDFARQGSFGHFLNQYYQCRRKARDGRYFLHPLPAGAKRKYNPGERRPRWDVKNKLLTLCPHRPRQKRHQMHADIAAIVGLTPAELEQKVKELNKQSIEDLLRCIKGFAANAENAAREQKEHRGELKLILQQGKDKKLNNLAKRIDHLAHALAGKLWPKHNETEQRDKAKRFNTLFSFAQIHNIVFTDRSGFSNTCPVCSSDNAGRMVEDSNKNALAARLPALSVRLIDGAVKRLLEYKSNEIARRHWALIEPDLHDGKKVCVPLILEQNRFNFEPSLKKLKGKNTRNAGKEPASETFKEKADRIRQASGGLCPYTGKPLSGSGELDHIIPRASAYGTLNDEANLIYVSQAANRRRSNQKYFIHNLNSQYKKERFPKCVGDDAIKQWIHETLCGQRSGGEARFVFGDYLSFIDLNNEQRVAFRHALFLDDDDPLKMRVIRALQNRNRTFVNGTQRFYAQLIADKLHGRSRKAGLAGNLSFDYFEYPADPRHPKGVQNLRDVLGVNKEEIQEDYSHHVDAHMAFLLACDDHRGDGSLGVEFGSIASVWPFIDGDISAYKGTEIDRDQVESVALGRKASATGNRPHRQYHRDNFYADRYMPLWLIPEETGITVKKGFSVSNSVDVPLSKKSAKEAALECVAKFANNDDIRRIAGESAHWEAFTRQLIGQSTKKPVYIAWSRHAIEKHCLKHFSAKSLAAGKAYSGAVTFVRGLAYQTQKKKINEPKDIEDALNSKETRKEIRKVCIDLPARREWQRLHDDWQQAEQSEQEDFQAFLEKWFLKQDAAGSKSRGANPRHKRRRQVFSLPIFKENAKYLQARCNIYGDPVRQLIADSDSRKGGNKFSRAAIDPDGNLVEVVNPAFASPRMFKLKQDKVYSENDYRDIDPNRWYELTREQAEQAKLEFPQQVRKIAYRFDNVSRPKIRITIDFDGMTPAQDDRSALVNALLGHVLTKPKNDNEEEKLDKEIREIDAQCFTTAPYIGRKLKKETKEALAVLFDADS